MSKTVTHPDGSQSLGLKDPSLRSPTGLRPLNEPDPGWETPFYTLVGSVGTVETRI